ncbi:MAG: hypothetical protein HXS41_03615 [Theionarchaea archaeon]|nr:hypothetical protein [Theionarchaea archaeon]
MKGKKALILVLALVVSLVGSTAFSENDSLSVDFTFEIVQMNPCVTCGECMVADTQIWSEPGAPLVPYRSVTILLPQGAELEDIKVRHGQPIVQKGIELPWGQPPCIHGENLLKAGMNETIYGSDNMYPSEIFQVVGVEYLKGCAILNVNLFPVQYMPQSGAVRFYHEMTVKVQLGKGTKNKLYRGLASDKAEVASLVCNPDVLTTYEDVPAPLTTEEYIIITNDTMQSTFQTLRAWKSNFVINPTVYTVSWISSNYAGTDIQMKMRNLIIDKYTNNGCKYVLLGGDVAAVPYRGFYVSTGGYTDSDMLADMYFGHLDGSHNSDGDSNYGEITDGVDFYAEVAVGRAPCQSVTEAQNFVNKVIAYDQAAKPERVLLHQSRVSPGNSPDSRCLAYRSDDYIPGDIIIDYIYEENGTITKAVWIQYWAQNPLIVVHVGLGNTNCYLLNYEVGGTVTWYNSDVASLTNTFWPWHTSLSSLTGQIEANDCLGEAYVMDPDNGAIACLMNDNYAWYSMNNACMYSGEFIEMMIRAFFSDGEERLGDMLNKAKSYLASSAQCNSTYRWCFYEINLIGDPESPCLTEREQ